MKNQIKLMGVLLISTAFSSVSFGQVNSATMWNGGANTPGSTGSYFGNAAAATGYCSFAGGSQVNATGNFSFAQGRQCNAQGAYSFAQGYKSYALGSYGAAIGTRTKTSNSHSFAFGIDVEASANRSMTLGSGVASGTGIDMINNIANSMMIGFNSNLPTLFVGGASGLNTTGNVGIGTSTPASKLDVNGGARILNHVQVGHGSSPTGSMWVWNSSTSPAVWVKSGGIAGTFEGSVHGVSGVGGLPFQNFSVPSEAFGVWGIGMNGSSISCGVHGDGHGNAGSNTGYSFGLWGSAYNGTIASYGVYGDGGNGGQNGFGSSYAGYFDGAVYSTISYQGSDRKLKDNIKPLTDTEKLLQIEAKEYTYRTDEYPRMSLEEGAHMGFIAQEIEKVFPNLVKDIIQPPKIDDEGKMIEEGTTFKAVNYIGLIPIMTATIQEQNEVLQKQEEELVALLERIERLENQSNIIGDDGISEAVLFQNVPNPFNESTLITYSLPSSVNEAQIIIFNLNGNHVTTLDIDVSANGRTILDANILNPGMYVYALIADGKEVSSKKMIVTN